MPCGVCSQPSSLTSMSRVRRWAVFAVGMVETMLWSGTVFGWASLVHVLKLQGIYSNLCPLNPPHDAHLFHNSSTNYSEPLSQNASIAECPEQDDRMALLYTVACVIYSTPSVFIGYSLHHLGLAFTRVAGGIMVSGGFVLLSLTTASSPDYLWGATVLLSVGGNTMRMSGLQFANLFPESRNTAMAVISGIFTPSAGIFMLLQTMYEYGIEWHSTCWTFAAASSLILAFTPFLPRHHVPVNVESEVAESADTTEKAALQDSESIKRSIFSLSSLLHAYWLFINLLGVTLFSTHFNTWINRFSETEEEAGHYSRLFGLANILCVFVTPLPGITMDSLGKRFMQGKSGVMKQVASLQAMILPMFVVSTTITTQTSMLFFRSPWAVYLGLVCLMLNRPSCLAVGNPFVRARFPADHFNRLIGIQGTVLSLLTFIQYPHFTWAQQAYNLTFGMTVAAMLLGLSHPLHLFSKGYLTRALQPLPPPVQV